jgi:hypothetical protein
MLSGSAFSEALNLLQDWDEAAAAPDFALPGLALVDLVALVDFVVMLATSRGNV